MSYPTTRGRGAGSPARPRTLTAAARAAAKRSTQRPEHAEEGRLSARTVGVEPPDGRDGWDDPPEPAPQDPAEPRKGRRRVRAVLLCALLAAVLVAVGFLGREYREGRRTEAARVQALAAARKAAPVVLSYDHRHLDRDFARARAWLTGDFREEYGRTTKAVVGPTATKYRGVVKATVATASVVSAAPDEAVVLLFVNQVTQSTQVVGSRLDLNRVRMTLTRTADGWKVSAVDAL
ncbi:hypothetical protein [Streptomyces sp. NPDC018693]|uniref:hypothetical protein n=1 Tax=unclassified Streptomyces TaxID=2593676 RepID=UPI0037B324D5